mmetsp:Transcript_42343/g.76367  ORF Transcript_42343/g.76367 Transcript_42343/m.76367 type:complete len:89 (+) Transcript_42343:821-1087(+)
MTQIYSLHDAHVLNLDFVANDHMLRHQTNAFERVILHEDDIYVTLLICTCTRLPLLTGPSQVESLHCMLSERTRLCVFESRCHMPPLC